MNATGEAILTHPDPHGHFVYPYTNESQFSEAVRLFISSGLRKGGSALLVMTDIHREAVCKQLQEDGLDVAELEAAGRLVCQHADDLLGTFMFDGIIDDHRFKTTVGQLIEIARAASSNGEVRVFGEMVDLIWIPNPKATQRLEELWNQVIKLNSVPLLCAYSLGGSRPKFFPSPCSSVIQKLWRDWRYSRRVMRNIRFALAALVAAALLQAADYDVKRLLPGSPFHGVHGLRFDKDDNLYAASVIGQSIYKIDPAAKRVTTFIAPPQGMADDLAFAPDGTLAWTSIEDGILHIKSPNGPVRNLMEHQRGVNGVSFSRDGKRLFVSLVFYGDALYEVDRNGVKPPRLIIKDMGGLNGFEVADDGMIYGPLWFKGKIVRINPDTSKLDVIAEGFKTPAAVKLDFKGYAYTPDTGTRELIRVDLKTGQKKVIAKLRSDLDNLAFNSKGKLFVSLSHLNAIDEVDVTTGQVTQFIPAGRLTSTAGLAVSTVAGHDTLYVADVFGGVRKVNPDTAAVADTPVEMFQPSHISLSAKHVTVVGQVNGFVQQFDRATFKKVAEWNGFKSPGDALELPTGEIVVAETATGNLLRATDHKILATGLSAPTGLANAGNNAVYVSETRAGQVTRIDLKTGEKSLIAPRLSSPEGLAVAPDGAILVVEVGAKRVTRLDLKTAMRTVIAQNLPIGLSSGPSLYRGIAISPSAIYINSDIENSIYKISVH